MAKAVFCIVNTTQAATIVDRLKASGFSSNDISVLMPDKSGTRDFAHDHATRRRSAATGAGTGAALEGR